MEVCGFFKSDSLFNETICCTIKRKAISDFIFFADKRFCIRSYLIFVCKVGYYVDQVQSLKKVQQKDIFSSSHDQIPLRHNFRLLFHFFLVSENKI